MEKKKVMLSQPMGGLSEGEILSKKKKATEFLKNKGYEVIDTFFDDKEFNNIMDKENVTNRPMFYLAKSIEAMSACDSVYFCKGWESARGCEIEHLVAEKYGLEIMEEV